MSCYTYIRDRPVPHIRAAVPGMLVLNFLTVLPQIRLTAGPGQGETLPKVPHDTEWTRTNNNASKGLIFAWDKL